MPFLKHMQARFMTNASCEIQNNLYAFYDQVAQCEPVFAEQQEHWSVISHQKGTWPRIIYRVSTDLDQKETSQKLFENVQSGRYPEVLIAPEKNIRQMDPFLRAHGFFPYRGWKGMARDYTEKIQQSDLPENIEIVNLEKQEDREQWVKIVSAELISPTRFDLDFTKRLEKRPGIRFFLLKYNAVGVCTMLTYDSGHSTGLYMIATDRNFQRKGLGHILVQQIVAQISQQSKNPVILHATQKGEGLYAKSDFLPCSQFFLYRYLNPQS